METVQSEGDRKVNRKLEFYNLDSVIAVGYRINSYQATQFRIWATKTLKEFITKGFVLDNERLKQGKNFGKDYFDELDKEFEVFRKVQDQNYNSYFDLEVKRIDGKKLMSKIKL